MINAKELKQLLGQSSRPFHVFNFYATYCKPCIKELPEIRSLYKENKEVAVHLIAMDGKTIGEDSLKAFLLRHEMDFPSLYFSDFDSASMLIKTLYPAWNNEIPLTLIMDKTGNIISSLGITDKKEIEAIVAEEKAFH